MKKRWLVICPGSKKERTVELVQTEIQLGRASQSFVCIDDAGVSSKHAILSCGPSKATLSDLSSKNGTFVNGKKIKTVQLKDGDRIRLARVEIMFHEKEMAAEPLDPAEKTELLLATNQADSVQKLNLWLSQLVSQGAATHEEAKQVLHDLAIAKANTSRFDALHHILESSLGERDLHVLLEGVLSEIKGLLDLDLCGLYLSQENRFYTVEKGELQEQDTPAEMSKTVLEKVLTVGKPVFLDQIGSNSQVLGFESLMKFNIQSLLCFPVMDSTVRVLGALYCVSKNHSRLQILEKDRQFLKACSTVVSLALDNRSLLNQVQAASRQSEKKRQESKFLPLVKKLQEEKENLSFRLANQAGNLLGGNVPALQELEQFVNKTAKAELPVLLTGETGVGKTVWAREIHQRSRPDKPFVVVDCTTLPTDLLESELFGHEKGAFTGATSKKEGKASVAKDGTFFIEEIGELPLGLQAKLLRLIQEREFETVGGTQTQKCKARLVFATNRNLQVEVDEKRFRSDLFFRLNVLNYTIPPLRELKNFIVPLAEFFLNNNREKINPKVQALSEEAKQALTSYPWPGNIRELENCILRGIFNAEGDTIEPQHLDLNRTCMQPDQEQAAALPGALDSFDLKEAREQLDRTLIQKALEKSNNNVAAAARELNVSRYGLIKLMKRYEL